MYGPANVTTFVMLGFALWVIFTRLRNRNDNNWPMIFYPVIILFAMQLPGRLDNEVLIAGLVTALVLRFEFVAGVFSYLVRAIDMGALCFICYNLLSSAIY